MRDLKYKVTYAIDSMDNNPTIKHFDCFSEAEDWIAEEVESRVSFQVAHSPYRVTEDDLDNLYTAEYQLIKIEEIAQ